MCIRTEKCLLIGNMLVFVCIRYWFKLAFVLFIFTLQGDANALHWSALSGNVDLLKFVLPKFTEADKLHDVDVNGNSLVHYASRNKQDNPEMVSYIVEELKFSPEEKDKVRHCWLQVLLSSEPSNGFTLLIFYRSSVHEYY